MREAFKEWSIIVDALGRGDQILIFRKGGIHEGPGGFKLKAPRFALFPTQFHQQEEAVVPEARDRFAQIQPANQPEGQVRIEYVAETVEWHHLENYADAERLQEQHIWKPEVIQSRFEWGRNRGIFAIAVRVFRLVSPVTLSLLAQYGGCKSWITLYQDISGRAEPVLDDPNFQVKMDQFRAALNPRPAATL